jgi:hypothetical protein
MRGLKIAMKFVLYQQNACGNKISTSVNSVLPAVFGIVVAQATWRNRTAGGLVVRMEVPKHV